MDSIFVDNKAVGLDVVSSHKVVVLHAVSIMVFVLFAATVFVVTLEFVLIS